MTYRRCVVVNGQPITLYSKDGRTWFMRPVDSLNHDCKRAAEREEIRQSLLRTLLKVDDVDQIPIDELR